MGPKDYGFLKKENCLSGICKLCPFSVQYCKVYRHKDPFGAYTYISKKEFPREKNSMVTQYPDICLFYLAAAYEQCHNFIGLWLWYHSCFLITHVTDYLSYRSNIRNCTFACLLHTVFKKKQNRIQNGLNQLSLQRSSCRFDETLKQFMENRVLFP